MPELPEVETVVRGLRRTITARTISRIKTQAPPSSIIVSQSFGKRRLEKILIGKTVNEISRRGKNILISLSDNITLWTHLKMTGRFLWLPKEKAIGKHDLVVIDFQSNNSHENQMHLRFNDYRRFGRLRLYRDDELWQQKGLATLGPEPLEISADAFVKLFQNHKRMIKPALLDQSFLVGIGNIYADESLYNSRIHPRRLTSSLSAKKLAELHSHIQRILKKAIRLMGSSVDTYAGVNGKPGRFQNYLAVYGREGDPCNRCGQSIVREKIGTRSAHYCPRCQRER